MVSTKVPDVIDMLVFLLRNHPDLPSTETRVLDGPQVNNDTIQTVIIVGWFPGGGGDSATVTRDSPGLIGRYVDESFSINVLINVRNGDSDTKAARDRMLEVLDVLSAILLTRDMSLEGTVDQVELGPSISWLQGPSSQGGVEVAVTCTVSGKALL